MTTMTITIEDAEGNTVQKVLILKAKPTVDLVEDAKWHAAQTVRAFGTLFGK